MKQLSLFDTKVYEKTRSHYDIEDGDDWPPIPVKESDWPPPVVSDAVTESADIVSDPVTESTEGLDLTDDSVTASMQKSVAKYRPKGTARGGEYWRFSYRDGRRVRHVHIPGGNSSNPTALARVEEVRRAIANRRSPSEIVEMIHSWTRKNP